MYTLGKNESRIFKLNSLLHLITGIIFLVFVTNNIYSNQWVNTWFHLMLIIYILISYLVLVFTFTGENYTSHKIPRIWGNTMIFVAIIFILAGTNIISTYKIQALYISLINLILSLILINRKRTERLLLKVKFNTYPKIILSQYEKYTDQV